MSRCVRFHEFGGPEVLKIEDVDVPGTGPKEVRLRIMAIGLNRSEVLTRSGRSATKATLPAQLGSEAAGLVEAVGSDGDGFAVGDRVAVVPDATGRGYYGELGLAPARALVKMPHHQSWQDAAATWAAFATAWIGSATTTPGRWSTTSWRNTPTPRRPRCTRRCGWPARS